MTRAAALALLALALLVTPETRATNTLQGYASAYSPGVMDDVIRTRFANDWWPTPPARGWYESHGAIAAMDCGLVGQMATVIDQDGREYWVLIADCPGDGDPERFARNNIIAELDYDLWQELTGRHGRPLSIALR